MLCEQCQQNVSTVYVTKHRDGVRTRLQLCRACADPLLEAIGPDEQTGAVFLEPPGSPQPLPERVAIPDPVTVGGLSETLGLRSYQLIAVLMRMGLDKSRRDVLDFGAAEEACARIGVVAEKRVE
jgi:hypothetical protein